MPAQLILEELSNIYNETMQNADERVEDWFMMSSPLPTLAITLLYYYIVIMGPKWMENREPFEFRRLLIIYNVTMVIVSGYLVYEFLMSGWLITYTFGCQLVDYSLSPQAMRIARACWVFYFSKLIELLDTVFFILRKKYNHVSFLHVIHHSFMPISQWLGVKFVPGGLSTFQSLLNSFIHLLMYSYYALAAGGPKMQKFLWWKRYMTVAQIIQLALISLHISQVFLTDCPYPVFFGYLILSNSSLILCLFMKFYIHSYCAKKTSANVTNGKVNGKVAKNGKVTENGKVVKNGKVVENGKVMKNGSSVKKQN